MSIAVDLFIQMKIKMVVLMMLVMMMVTMMMLVMMMVVAMMMMVLATYGSEGVLGDVVALQVNSGEGGVRLHFIFFSFFRCFNLVGWIGFLMLFSHVIGVIIV